MSEYTAEDFKNARFAVLPRYGFRAHRSAWEFYWQRDGIGRATNAEMAAAGWRPVREHAPLTLDTLREAWENGEVPTEANPVRKGDEVIRAIDLRARDAFEVSIAESWLTGVWSGREGSGLRVRVLRRAPQPEPWQDLAEAIEHYGWEVDSDDPKALARHLHERGVRVTGGDEA